MKDYWDKAEIAAKIVGAIAVPIILACLAYAWNSERTTHQVNAERFDFALQILREPTQNQGVSVELRDWAAAIIQTTLDTPIRQPADLAIPEDSAFDAEVCAAVLPYLVELGLAAVENGGAKMLSTARNTIAVMDAICTYRGD